MVDLTLRTHGGGIWVITACTPAGETWIAEHMVDARKWCGGYVVEVQSLEDVEASAQRKGVILLRDSL
jgi:hypothetical protein